MGHNKRTKKDVEEAYRRGFYDGFNVRPNPLAMLLRSIWRRHELNKARKAFEQRMKAIKENGNIAPLSLGLQPGPTIGVVKSFTEDASGLHAEIEFKEPPSA